MTQAPYLCMSSAFDWYLSAGLTSGAFSCPMGSLGRVRGLTVSFGVGTAMLRLVVAMHRERATLRPVTEGLAGLIAAARALLPVSLVAIVSRERRAAN